MTPRLAPIVLAALAAAAPSDLAAPQYWLDVAPQGSCETAIREALTRSAFQGPVGTADALVQAAAQCPGTPASGLAHLAAGLLLVDAARTSDALSQLAQADIQKTAIADYAVLGRAQALDAANDAGAASAYVAAADVNPAGPNVCRALVRASDLWEKSGEVAEGLQLIDRTMTACPDRMARLLLDDGALLERQRQPRAAAEAYRRLDVDYPVSPEAAEARRRLATLGVVLPTTPEEANARDLKRALAFFAAGEHREALALLRSLAARRLAPADRDLVETRLGRSLIALKRLREARVALSRVGIDSPSGPEAAFYRARLAEEAQDSTSQLEAVAALFPASPWAEEALLALANHYQKDARDDDALPYYRRLLQAFPAGRYADRAAWKVGWGDYRHGQFEDAALTFERAARLDPTSNFTPGMLYWAGRARVELGQIDRARQLFDETVSRYKRAYHGLRAQAALARLPGPAPTAPPSLGPPADDARETVPEPYATRVRQLALIGRMDDAAREIQQAPPTSLTRATLAWIDVQRGDLRPAINAMKAAHPEYLSAAGDALPDDVWRILYPIQYTDELRARATQEGLDPALVAALICQESTFDAGAVSRAGARGLMQLMPHTGRTLARSLGVRYASQSLHDPDVSLAFGTRYLRTLLDRFDGHVERALAAYNAGPERVEAWTALHPDISEEEFIENVPFTETRLYVMIVLASREQYRRLYDLRPPSAAAVAGALLP